MTALELARYTSAELTTIADALKKLAAVAQQSPAAQSSVQIEQAAKGPPRITVKIYAEDAIAAATQAVQLYDRLTAKYAVAEGAG